MTRQAPGRLTNPLLRPLALRAALCSLLCAGPVLAAPGERIGSRIEVDASGGFPAIASNSAGEFVVAWRSFGGGPVMARRFDATGVAAGDAFVVGSGAIAERAPSVAMNARGEFVIAWATQRTEVLPLPRGALVRPGRVFARRYAPGGVALGAAFEVAAEGDEADVAIDDDGDFAVAYAVDGNRGRSSLFVPIGYLPIVDLDLGVAGVDRIAVRRYAADGRAFAPQLLDRQPELLGRGASGVSVAMAADGGHAVVWSRRTSRMRSEIVAQRFSAAGVATGAELKVSRTDIGGRDRVSPPDAAMSPLGTLAVTWSPDLSFDQRGPARIAVFAPDNTVQVAEFAAAADAGVLVVRPKIAIDALGHLHLAAGNGGSQVSALQTRLYSDQGVPQIAPTPVLPAGMETFPDYSAISVDGAGRAAIVHLYLPTDFSGARLSVQRFAGP